MGLLRACVITEQTAGQLNAVQVDTAVYGTSAGALTIRSGREAKTYIIAGTQTSSLTTVVLDLFNAAAGDTMTVKKYTTAVIGTGAAQLNVVSGSAAGAIVGAIQVGTAAPNQVDAFFDGVQWR